MGTGWTSSALEVHASVHGDSVGKSSSARGLRRTVVVVVTVPLLQAHGGDSGAQAHRALWLAGATEGHCQAVVLPALPGEVLPLSGTEFRGDGGDAALSDAAAGAGAGAGRGAGTGRGVARAPGREGARAPASGAAREREDCAKYGQGGHLIEPFPGSAPP